MHITIDRFEGDLAVCELDDGSFVNLPRALVPKALEGDVVEIRIDRNATSMQRQKIDRLVNELFED